MGRDKNILSAIDVGTKKVSAYIALENDGVIELIGVGTHISKGISEGVVVNIEEASDSIRKAVEDAEIMADTRITGVFVNIGGKHIKGYSSTGSVTLEEGIVREKDIKKAIEHATAFTLPTDREFIHILPSEFLIDGYGGIKEPLGMSGLKLEVKIHAVTGLTNFLNNLRSSCRKAGVKVKEFVLGSLSSAEAVLTNDEKELGVLLVDIGEGKTSGIIFIDGAVWTTFEIPVGGKYITKDIATGLRVNLKEAERLKKEKGVALPSMVKKDEEIEVTSLANPYTSIIPRKFLAEIIEARVEEIMEMIDAQLKDSNIKSKLHAGAVFTGGTSLLQGITDIGENILSLPVRIGYPIRIDGVFHLVNSPENSCGIGLLLYALKREDKGGMRKFSNSPKVEKMYRWIKNAFANVF